MPKPKTLFSSWRRDPTVPNGRAGAEARALAEQIGDPETKRTMLKNADDYERLAQRAQERAAGRWPQSK
jgi:hypothetical protein